MQLQIRCVSKSYANDVQALENVSLTISKGAYGLLGPSGAGKSTLIRIVATLLEPDDGSVTLVASDMQRRGHALAATLGYVAQEVGVFPKMSAERVVDYWAQRKRVADRPERYEVVERLLRRVDLWDVRQQKPAEYSAGMRQRLAIAVALLGNPTLMLVDEPTAGLDRAGREAVLALLSDVSEERILLVATQLVDDVSELCSRMAIIDRGEILLEADTLRAVANLRGRVWSRMVSKPELSALEREYAVISTRRIAGQTLVRVYSDAPPGIEFEAAEPELRDVYVSAITGRIGLRREQMKLALTR